MAEEKKYNVWAIVGFICSFVVIPLGFVFSLIALNQLKKTNEEGKGLAIAGLIISSIGLLGIILYFVFVSLLFAGVVASGVAAQ